MVVASEKVPLISDATLQNWRKLHSDESGRLTSRANKRLSKKTILPVEYFTNPQNVADIQRFVDFCNEKKYGIGDVMFSVGMNLLGKKHQSDADETCSGTSLQQSYHVIPEIIDYQFPTDEIDLLGLIYQMLLTEGEKNTKGSYYTPFSIARKMVQDLDFSGNQTFFDPCCGSGIFMLAIENARPSQIFGCDNDPIAVMLAKFNLLLKFPNEEFEPQIYCLDYLNTYIPKTPTYLNTYIPKIPTYQNTYSPKTPTYLKHLTHLFTYISSNPPWGALLFDSENKKISKKESFSVFFEKSFQQLENEGVIRFLLPESIMNVKCHKAFREFLLSNGNLTSISLYSGAFTGVQTKYVDVELRRNGACDSFVKVVENGAQRLVSKDSFLLTKNFNFNLLTADDEQIVKRILSKGKYTLKGSTWALGVITGDNKNKLKAEQGRGLEPIFTGKEIEPYTLKKPRKFIKYERSEFQQVAKDEIYRADEKLVYKFISNNLVFAYDNTKSLFLNSANILIPNISGMSIKTVLAFLNSDLFKFLYKSLFGEIKILKGNLMELPFPEITVEQDFAIQNLVNQVLNGDRSKIEEINKVVNGVFF